MIGETNAGARAIVANGMLVSLPVFPGETVNAGDFVGLRSLASILFYVYPSTERIYGVAVSSGTGGENVIVCALGYFTGDGNSVTGPLYE